MFERVIDLFNTKRGSEQRLTKKILAERMVVEGLTPSYQYARRLMDAVDKGGQLRINYKILQFTADYCEISLDELFKNF